MHYEHSGAAWRVDLSHQEVSQIAAVGATAPVFVTLPPPVKAAIIFVIRLLVTVDELGGEKGVTVTGIIGTSSVIVTPPGVSPFHSIANVGQLIGQAGGAISDAWKEVGSEISKPWHAVLSTSTSTNVLHNAGISLSAGHQNNHTPGGVFANRTAALEWETLLLFALGGNDIALLSWQGYFSAQPNGSVYANRDKALAWEKWTLERNGDGTLSLKSTNFNHYFTAEGGGGSFCTANRTAKGAWERFRLVYLAEGIALKASNGNYVSVQP